MLSVKKYVMSVVFIALAGSAFAESFKGDWTHRYPIKGGLYIEHTPNYVTLGGFLTAGGALKLGPHTSINGIHSACDLVLKTDSTRAEFEQALQCSELLV